jgi:hypothetical protein
MEAMTQKFMLHRRPHVKIWSAREGSDDDTNKIHLRNKTLMDPKQCQPWTKGPLQKPKSDGSPIPFSNHGPLQKPKSDETQTTNHRITKEVHLKTQILMDLNNHILMSRWSTSETTTDGSKQNINQTQVFFPGYDYTSYKAIGGKSHILTARILRRRNSRRRIGKPQQNGNRINRNRSWYKIGFNFYNKSSLQRTNYPSARHNDSAKVQAHIHHKSFTKKKTEPRTVMSEPLTNPDSQSDTQEAIQSEQAKGTPLIQPS